MFELRYFTEEEINKASFGCDNGFEHMSVKALVMLDELRHKVGFPLRLTCAYRTKDWDLSKGRSGNSMHTQGIAFDIKCSDSVTRHKVVKAAMVMGFKGIGIHKDFVHVDVRKENPVLWLY